MSIFRIIYTISKVYVNVYVFILCVYIILYVYIFIYLYICINMYICSIYGKILFKEINKTSISTLRFISILWLHFWYIYSLVKNIAQLSDKYTYIGSSNQNKNFWKLLPNLVTWVDTMKFWEALLSNSTLVDTALKCSLIDAYKNTNIFL